MNTIEIRIQSLEEAKTGKALFPELIDILEAELVVRSIGILEGGMKSGKTSLALNLFTNDGKAYVAQLSAEELNMINSAVQGAVQRFGK